MTAGHGNGDGTKAKPDRGGKRIAPAARAQAGLERDHVEPVQEMLHRLDDALGCARLSLALSGEAGGDIHDVPHILVIHSANDAILGRIYKKAAAWEFECGEDAYDPDGAPCFHSVHHGDAGAFAGRVLRSLKEGLLRYEKTFLLNPPERR